MITKTDGNNSLEFEQYFVILTSMYLWNTKEYCAKFKGKRCEEGFYYNSGENTDWLTVDDIRELIKTHLDPSFTY